MASSTVARFPNSAARWRAKQRPITFPTATSRAAKSEVMGMPLHLPRTHGQKRLCAVERLDLALLVDTQYDRSLGRIEVKPDDITHLFDKQRIGRELECVGAMGLQSKRLADAVY